MFGRLNWGVSLHSLISSLCPFFLARLLWQGTNDSIGNMRTGLSCTSVQSEGSRSDKAQILRNLSASIGCLELQGLLRNDPENLFGTHSELLFTVNVYISGGFHLVE